MEMERGNSSGNSDLLWGNREDTEQTKSHTKHLFRVGERQISTLELAALGCLEQESTRTFIGMRTCRILRQGRSLYEGCELRARRMELPAEK